MVLGAENKQQNEDNNENKSEDNECYSNLFDSDNDRLLTFCSRGHSKVIMVLQENGGLKNATMLEIFNFPDEIANNTQLIHVLL